MRGVGQGQTFDPEKNPEKIFKKAGPETGSFLFRHVRLRHSLIRNNPAVPIGIF